MPKYIIVCGGVISAVGKGCAACSVGMLLKSRGFNIQYIKFDPYLNTASTIRPGDHGESYVCDDGTESDLDLGYAERLLGITVTKRNIATSGILFKQLIEEQEAGKYLGATCQLNPHVTDLIQQRLMELSKDNDVVIAEIGGTVGDAESYAFFEAARQFKQKYSGDVLIVMVAPILWINTIQEFKTKPLQNAIRELQRQGLQPDVLFCRVDRPVPEKILDKVSNLTGIKRNCIVESPDVSTIYQVPLEFYDRHVDDLFVDLLRLSRSSCRIHKYREVVEKYVNNHMSDVEIAVVGKYDNTDAYLSLKEALIHAGVANDVKVNIRWIKAEELEHSKDMRGVWKWFEGVHGIIVPGGFDTRGIEGKIKAIQYVREKKIPFLGICLGLQCAVIEIARNVAELEDANSIEFKKDTKHPVIHFVEGQEHIKKKEGTMRLGAYDCELMKDSQVLELYKKRLISERHRHRYEVNAQYLPQLAKVGFKVSGENPETKLVEMMELDSSIHPFFVGTQSHPEFRSRLTVPAPLFVGLISAAISRKKLESTKTDGIIDKP